MSSQLMGGGKYSCREEDEGVSWELCVEVLRAVDSLEAASLGCEFVEGAREEVRERISDSTDESESVERDSLEISSDELRLRDEKACSGSKEDKSREGVAVLQPLNAATNTNNAMALA